MSDDGEVELRSLTPEERSQQKRRNIAMALAIIAFVVIVFLVTILRLGASVTERSF